MKKILLIAVLLAGAVFPIDKTPYNFVIIRCGARGTQSLATLAQRYDGITHLGDLGPIFFDSIMTAALAQGKTFFPGGPYGSTQEVNLYYGNIYATYAQRMADTARNWFYILAKHYLDSIGVSVESLVVHIADTDYTLYNRGRSDGVTRTVHRADTLAWQKRRFTYQYYDNEPNDAQFYPAGYLWLANGRNADARRAIAYAFRRRFFDPVIRAKVDGALYQQWNYCYMDNQYYNYGPLYTYWQAMSSAGGPTSSFDWQEYNRITDDSVGRRYHRESTCLIDSVVRKVCDSVATATGGREIVFNANVNWGSSSDALQVVPYVDEITLEGPIQPDRWPGHWNGFYTIADAMNTTYKGKYILWALGGDNFSGSFASDGLNRSLMGSYCFFLTVQDTNAFVDMGCFAVEANWRDLFEIDLGRPDSSSAADIYSGGSAWYGPTPYNWVKARYYDDSNNVVLFRTTASTTYNLETDSVKVTLPDNYYEITINGDTSSTATDTTWIHPFEGQVFTKGAVGPGIPPHITLSTETQNNTIAISGIVGGSNPNNRTFTVTNSGDGTMIWTAVKTPGSGTWFTVTPACDTGNGVVTISFNTTGVPPGSATGLIVITSAQADNPNQLVTINLTMTSLDKPHVVLSPTTLVLNAFTGATYTDTGRLSIENTGAGQMDWTIATAKNYMALSAYSGGEPESLVVLGIVYNLPIGIYYDTLTVTCPEADNPSVVCPVTINVKTTIIPPVTRGKHIQGVRKKSS